MATRRGRKPFKRLSHEYIVAKRKAGVESIDILNSYSQREIAEWFHRGMANWYAKKGLWAFSPLELEFWNHGDWSVMEGVYRICNNKQVAPRTHKYIREAVFKSLAKTPADEASLMLFGDLCQMAVNLTPATKVLRAVPSLLRGDTDEAFTERLYGLRNVVHDLASKAPKTSVKVLHRLLLSRAFKPEFLGTTLVRLVEVDPQGLKAHLKSLTFTAQAMRREVSAKMTPWLNRDILKMVNVAQLREALQAPEWQWLLRAVESAARKKRTA